MSRVLGRLSRLLHGGEEQIGRLELVLAHALRQERLRVVLARQHVQLCLRQLEGPVL